MVVINPSSMPKPSFEQHVHDRSQAIGRAARVADDVVPFGIVLVVVHAHHDGDVLAFARHGNDDLLRAAARCPFASTASVNSRGFDHDIDAHSLPWKGRRTLA